MPYKKGYRKKKNYRRKYKKYRNKNLTIATDSKYNLTGFPATRRMKFRYCDKLALNAGIGNISVDYIGANDPYDPYTGVGGHQPLGWDQITPFYNHYVVVGSRISATFSNNTNGSHYGPAQACGIYLADDNVTPVTVETMIEQGLGTWKFLNQSQTRGGEAVTVSHNFSAKKFYNITDVKDNVARIGAAVNTSPTEKAEYAIWTGTTGAGDPGALDVLVVVEYIVDFSEPKSLATS